MAGFIEVARLDEIPPGSGTCVDVAGRRVAIFNVEGAIYAMEDCCLHQGLSLGTSKMEGKVVTCRGHGRRYKVTTGEILHVPDSGVATYPVKVVEGKIMVAVDNSPKAA